MQKIGLLAAIILFISFKSLAQTGNLKGHVADNKDNSPVFGAVILIAPVTDSTSRIGTKTDFDGNFQFSGLAYGNYILRAVAIGYNDAQLQININHDTVIQNISLEGVMLKEVVIEGLQSRVQQNGDTTQFNAGAYKTNPDANAEDLITKMPGVTSENGQVKVHGENVQQVLVDGKPFFGDDANIALKNLPAEIIDKIQVFDKASDQSEFTGFNDGNTNKTVNIITKKGTNKGQFGKIYAGYGTANRYTAGGNINLFNGERKLSILGLSNNINQQNFSADDLLGLSGGGNSGRNRERGGRGNMQRGGSDGGNFLIGQQGGIATTHALGLNYSNSFGKKIKLSGSYFFNNSINENFTLLNREYITSQDSGFVYDENSSALSDNVNHRLNMRLEYNIDSSNSIIFTPRLGLTDNFSETDLLGKSIDAENSEISRTESDYTSGNFGYNLNGNILYRHKFAKKGRTISLNLGTDNNYRSGNANLLSQNNYDYFTENTFIDQIINTNSNSKGYNTNITYTEPLDSTSQLMFSYLPTITLSESNRETSNFDSIKHEYSGLASALSNRFNNSYFTNRGGISYRKSKQKFNFMAGVNYQHATLKGEQFYPAAFMVSKTFTNILPQAMLNYKFTRSKNIRINYRTNTNAPSINQLQNVIDNNNPLLLRLGNPDLKQSYTHSVSNRYGSSNTLKGTSFLFFVMGNFTQDYIGNSTQIAVKDTFIGKGILLNRGSQLARPVNIDGFWSMRTFLTFGLPVKFLKSNLNLNSGLTYNHTPAIINEKTNFANNYNFNQGAVLGSNISEKIDFSISYTANYSIVKNTIQRQSDNNYFSQVSSVRLNLMPYKGFVLNTTINHTSFTGLAQDIDNDYILWNASLGYKLLKNKSLEAKVSVYDLLNENNSISRNVTETYIEDSETNVLNRFFMFTLTYNVRKFGESEKP